MPLYSRDYMHCSQDQCKLKDQCYRYWLGQEIKNNGFQYASFYYPKEPVTDGCTYFIKKEYFD